MFLLIAVDRAAPWPPSRPAIDLSGGSPGRLPPSPLQLNNACPNGVTLSCPPSSPSALPVIGVRVGRRRDSSLAIGRARRLQNRDWRASAPIGPPLNLDQRGARPAAGMVAPPRPTFTGSYLACLLASHLHLGRKEELLRDCETHAGPDNSGPLGHIGRSGRSSVGAAARRAGTAHNSGAR